MIDLFVLLLQFVGVVWLFLMFVAPLSVYWSSRSPCTYTLIPEQKELALASANSAFNAASKQLDALGFTVVACSSMAMSHASTKFAVFRKPNDNCLATVSICSNAFTSVAAVEFSQLYAGDCCLSLTSSPTPPVYPKWPKKRCFRLPGATDVADLFARFCRLRERHSMGKEVIVPDDGELSAIEAFMNAEIRHLCDLGFLQRECSGGLRRSSIWAAYSMSWRVLPPWKRLILSKERRVAVSASEA